MGSKFPRLKWVCFSFLFFFVVSCSLNQELKKPEGEKFLQEISRLEKLAREDPAVSVRAKSHLSLAFLHVNCRNPQLSYSKALREMESYLSMSPTEAQTDDFRNWLAVLKEVDRLRKDKKGIEGKNHDLQTQIEKMRISLKKVQEANKNLGEEVANLQKMIEELKNLDREMEEERNLIK